jgi:hypothetical protein
MQHPALFAGKPVLLTVYYNIAFVKKMAEDLVDNRPPASR